MNNATIRSAIILIDNLLNHPKNFSRSAFKERLLEEDLGNQALPSSDSAISRILNFINVELGLKIKVNRTNFLYEIDYEASSPNFSEKYEQYKNLFFRSIIQNRALENDIVNDYISFGFAVKNKNVDFVNPILTALIEGKKIELEYCPFYESTPFVKVVKPLFIKEYLNRWYLITEKLDDRHPIFAFDRIKKYTILEAKFKKTHLSKNDIFKDTIGINFSEPVGKVVLWVSKHQYHYFDTLPLHASQKTERETENGFIISFNVTLNYELKQWILHFGRHIKVIEPQSLKTEIIEELKSNLNQYKN